MTRTTGRLQGKRAVLTGAGSGIGRAAALLFAAEGAAVFVSDLRGDSAEETARLIGAGGDAGWYACDVGARRRSRSDRRAVVRLGGLDTWSSAPAPSRGRLHGDASRLGWVIRVNLRITSARGPPSAHDQGRRRGRGRLGVSVVSGRGSSSAAYKVNRQACCRWRGPSPSVCHRGIRSNCVCPAGVETGWSERTPRADLVLNVRCPPPRPSSTCSAGAPAPRRSPRSSPSSRPTGPLS